MLGPPVCLKCRVVFSYDINDEEVKWFCPKCGITESSDYAFTVPEEILQECIRNKEKDG